MSQNSPQFLPSLAVFAAGAAAGLTSLFTRMSQHSDAFDIQVLRCAPFAVVLFIVLAVSKDPLWRWPTKRDWLLGLFMLGCFYAFILGAANTSIARTVFAITTYPLWAAVFAWAILGERPTKITVAALGLALTGLFVMTSSGLFGDPVGAQDLLGMSFALMGGVSCGAMLVVLRLPQATWPGVPTRGYFVGALMVVATGIAFGGLPQPTRYDLAVGVAHGVLGLGITFCLVAWGASRIPAARAGMFLALEVISGPALVWLLLGETEAPIVYAGGALVFAAILLLAIRGGKLE